MEPETINKRHTKHGGQPGNQNARKHGFYSMILDDEERADLELAIGEEGLDIEIALLRVKIKSILRHTPENIELLMKAMGVLCRLVMTRNNINKTDKKGMKTAIGNVLKDIALPLGIGIGTVIKK
jgi:hypothetical protein